MKNFVVLFEEFEMKRWEVKSEMVWDGEFVYFRFYCL